MGESTVGDQQREEEEEENACRAPRLRSVRSTSEVLLTWTTMASLRTSARGRAGEGQAEREFPGVRRAQWEVRLAGLREEKGER